MKRTRPIRGKYYLTIPRVAVGGRILEIKLKISQVIVTDLGPTKTGGDPRKWETSTGEIERGRVDGEEE